VETRQGIRERHLQHLAHQHMRYMWIPHTDTVVVVTCDPVPEGLSSVPKPPDEFRATAPLRELLLSKTSDVSSKAAADMNFAQLRDALLALDPLSTPHIKQVNAAEAEFWKRSQGYRIDWSDRILGFECGGNQWVSEVVFPCGTLDKPSGHDLGYMRDLLALVEASDFPAPSPIEQRWTLRSSSPMSPAHSSRAEDVHSWVGIIMYLPEDEVQRKSITDRFWEYNAMCRKQLWPKYGAHQHWAKIEPPSSAADLAFIQQRLRERFPLDKFNEARAKLDPKSILINPLLQSLFGQE